MHALALATTTYYMQCCVGSAVDLFICATIRSKTEAVLKEQVISLQATFVSPVAGTVYFRQNSNEPTVIFGKLFWVTESRMDNVEWSISSELVSHSLIATPRSFPVY